MISSSSPSSSPRKVIVGPRSVRLGSVVADIMGLTGVSGMGFSNGGGRSTDGLLTGSGSGSCDFFSHHVKFVVLGSVSNPLLRGHLTLGAAIHGNFEPGSGRIER